MLATHFSKFQDRIPNKYSFFAGEYIVVIIVFLNSYIYY
ncbi:hypothetical protein FM106_07335 [Brachybacterium faecium]|nr:hypothetical protein FM106_07335 [Brachybacterium faecium]